MHALIPLPLRMTITEAFVKNHVQEKDLIALGHSIAEIHSHLGSDETTLKKKLAPLFSELKDEEDPVKAYHGFHSGLQRILEELRPPEPQLRGLEHIPPHLRMVLEEGLRSGVLKPVQLQGVGETAQKIMDRSPSPERGRRLLQSVFESFPLSNNPKQVHRALANGLTRVYSDFPQGHKGAGPSRSEPSVPHVFDDEDLRQEALDLKGVAPVPSEPVPMGLRDRMGLAWFKFRHRKARDAHLKTVVDSIASRQNVTLTVVCDRNQVRSPVVQLTLAHELGHFKPESNATAYSNVTVQSAGLRAQPGLSIQDAAKSRMLGRTVRGKAWAEAVEDFRTRRLISNASTLFSSHLFVFMTPEQRSQFINGFKSEDLRRQAAIKSWTLQDLARARSSSPFELLQGIQDPGELPDSQRAQSMQIINQIEQLSKKVVHRLTTPTLELPPRR